MTTYSHYFADKLRIIRIHSRIRVFKNMKIIAGLGNPDKKYLSTRHNVGFLVVDKLAELRNLTWQTNKDWNLMMAKGMDYILVKPLTYMNNSGDAVRKIMDYYNLMPAKIDVTTDLSESLVVIHDDMDIKLGEYKFAIGSSSAGHNGINSIIEVLGTKNFARLRVGIATPDLEKYRHSLLGNRAHKFVLNNFPAEEKSIIAKLSEDVFNELV